jgi:hypothetical protein
MKELWIAKAPLANDTQREAQGPTVQSPQFVRLAGSAAGGVRGAGTTRVDPPHPHETQYAEQFAFLGGIPGGLAADQPYGF